jgi:chaperone required for assembly of F1-ATPase
MRQTHGRGRRETEREALDRLLKDSAYLRESLSAIERAAAAANAQILGVLIAAGQLDLVEAMGSLRAMSTAFDPKKNAPDASARRRAAALLLDELAAISRESAMATDARAVPWRFKETQCNSGSGNLFPLTRGSC